MSCLNTGCGAFTDGYAENNAVSLREAGGEVGNILAEEMIKYYGEFDGHSFKRPRRQLIREQLADNILLTLGAPLVEVNLDSQQLSLAIDDALRRYEEYCDRSEFAYATFQTIPGVNKYKLEEDIGMVLDVTFRSSYAAGGIGGGSGAMDIGLSGGMAPWAGAYYYNTLGYGYSNSIGGSSARTSPVFANLGEWTLLASYSQLFQRIASRETAWEIGADNSILLSPVPWTALTCVVKYMQRKRDYHEVPIWVFDYALANAKEILGRVRSKFDKLGTPGGGVSLDGKDLLSEAKEAKKELLDQIDTASGNASMFPLVM